MRIIKFLALRFCDGYVPSRQTTKFDDKFTEYFCQEGAKSRTELLVILYYNTVFQGVYH